jgi:broad specificity phosphatase PhoE
MPGFVCTIVLARHGKPAWDETTPIPGYALADWARGRDAAPIDPGDPPPAELVGIARSSRVLASSPLRRSLESAQAVAPGGAPRVDPLFREVALPAGIRAGLRLRPTLWSSLARLTWYLGWSPDIESYTAARERAALAAAALAGLAAAEETVLLVGHGIMNGMIGRRLRRAGWNGPWVRSRHHWAFMVYRRTAG